MVLSCVKYGPCGKDLDSWINIMLFTHLVSNGDARNRAYFHVWKMLQFASIAGLFLGAVILQNKLSYDKGIRFIRSARSISDLYLLDVDCGRPVDRKSHPGSWQFVTSKNVAPKK